MAVNETIGKLDRSVEIVQFVNTKDEYNSNVRTQGLVKRVWAQEIFKASSEDFEEKVYSINRRDYVIHWDDVIAAKTIQDLAVVDDGVVYYVTGFNSNYGGRKMFMLLNCKSDV